MPRPDGRSLVDRIWFGDDPLARVARAALTPLGATYGAVSRARGALYDADILRSFDLPIASISVGNLTVGGTGKTPVAAWLAGELARRGASPAVVLRGYGDDEPQVHARLNPRAIVIADPDRVAGVRAAAAQGADVVVLDDAFQHRRARRNADVVLVSADRWPARVRMLPAGPFREPLGALARASLVLVTRKAASPAVADAVEAVVRRSAGAIPVARAHLAPGELVDVGSGSRTPLAAIHGRAVLAICGIGDPSAFERQLAAQGASVHLRAFPDHHAFSGDDIAALVDTARGVAARGGLIACTLKDAVKLAARWPAKGPALSFVSQRVILESGHAALDRLLGSVLHARRPDAPAPG